MRKLPDFDKLDDEDILIKSTPLTTEEEDAFSKFLAENKKKNAKAIARINAKVKKALVKAKSKKGIS